jgi:hypothetical protein
LRVWILSLTMLACASLAHADDSVPLERGTAVTDPYALRELDRSHFGVNRMLAPARAADAPLTDAALFALPSMRPVRAALDVEFAHYIDKHKATLPDESIGVGTSFAFQLFDRAMLDSPDARFVLSGVINRMDRAYADPDHCGEIRLLYRLTRTMPVEANDEVSPRLPMTLNLVLKARSDDAIKRGTPSCAEIARRWLDTTGWQLTGGELAARLTGADGPLALIAPENIVRIETNLQIAHAPKSAVRDFRTDYLMKVFDYKAATATFEEAVLEDQIDRDRLRADADLARAFKSWLLDPVHLGELDRGTVLIPDKFLARVAVAPTPVGFVNSDLQPAFGLVQGDEPAHEGSSGGPVFSDADVVGALEQAAAKGVALQNVQSVAGFERRLNDIGCEGCHQTRGIGGFHFPGVDWMAAKPSNTVVVPGSPHFFGDQVRRRDILMAFQDGKEPDLSRGFASRPQLRSSSELAGTPYDDGWGGHCYVNRADAAGNDKSFSAWTCASGLSCQAGPATRMGMCFISTR